MKGADRFNAVTGIVIISALVGSVIGSTLFAVLPIALVCMLMTVGAIFWGALWAIGYARESKEFSAGYALTLAFAITLSTIAGFWEIYAKHVEHLEPLQVSRQQIAIVALALAIALFAEYRKEIGAFLESASVLIFKRKTAP